MTKVDTLVDAVIEAVIDFRVRYGYERKLDDPELHHQLVSLLQEQASASTDETTAYKAMETALQLLTAQILNLRTELLVIKAEIMKDKESTTNRA